MEINAPFISLIMEGNFTAKSAKFLRKEVTKGEVNKEKRFTLRTQRWEYKRDVYFTLPTYKFSVV